MTAEEAIIDLNQPLSFNAKPDSEPIVVKHARLERNVMIRDDRGTINDRADDLVIGPLTWVEFDDDKLQLYSDSNVLIVDRDTESPVRDADQASSQVGVRAAGRALGRFRGSPERTAQSKCPRVFTNVSKTGILPDTGPTKRGEPRKAEVQVQVDAQRAGRMARPRTRQAQSPSRWTSGATVRCRSISPSRTCRSRRARRRHRAPRWCTSNATWSFAAAS